MGFLGKLRALLPSDRAARERDMQDELESLKTRAARNELGNLTLAAEDARQARTFVWLERSLQDIRYALRTLRRSPGFTLNWHEHVQSLDALVSYETLDFRIPTSDGPLPARAAFVAQDFWKVSGVRPAFGSPLHI